LHRARARAFVRVRARRAWQCGRRAVAAVEGGARDDDAKFEWDNVKWLKLQPR
jgi:hypothetical protein